MRPTSVIGLVGLALIGVIIADVLTNANGTKAAANGIVSIETPGLDAMLGKAP
jgi:ABC-type phosphate/phosphonate transport system permease subunit